MNLWNTLDLYGGGPGSGCRGPNCGRPESANHLPNVVKKANKWRQYDPKKVGGYFKPGTVIAEMYKVLAAKAGEYHEIKEFEERFKRTGMPVIMNRLKELKYTGKRSGRWALDFIESKGLVRMRFPVGQQPIAPAPKASPKERAEPVNQNADDVQQTLANGKIVETKHLGGGINAAKLVTFENGQKAVMKTDGAYDQWSGKNRMMDDGRKAIIPGLGVEREVAAYQVAKIVGMDDLVPVTVARVEDGKKAVVQEFRKGSEAADKPIDVRFDGNEDAARAAAFDYVIGMEDRHKGNWMINNQGKLTLIDHGLSFPDTNDGMYYNQQMIANAMASNFKPKDSAAPYVENKTAIANTLSGLGLRDEMIQGVLMRIGRLATADRYKDIAPNPKAKAYWVDQQKEIESGKLYQRGARAWQG